MKRFRDFCVNAIETFIGPFNWQVKCNGASTTFKGNFLVYDCRGRVRLRIAGHIVQWTRLPVQVYLYDPPEFLRNHRHGSCLQLLRPNDKWYKLHFAKPAKDFPDAYTYVEYFLTEAYNATGNY